VPINVSNLVLETALKEKNDLMSVGVAAKKAGVSRQSLQYYLMLGLLEPVEITSTGRRLFDQKTVGKIRLIKKLNDSGYTLRAIRELFFHDRGDLKGNKT